MSTSISGKAELSGWRIKRFDQELVRALCEQCGVSVPTAKALLLQGCTDPGRARAFLSPSFDNWTGGGAFPSLIRGVEILSGFVRGGKKLCIHGDYDADGVAATVILRECLRLLGVECGCHVPTREEGHGISGESVKRIAETGAEVIVTVDCGINAVEQVKLASSLGMEVVITDHHLPDAELPPASAVISPQADGAEGFLNYSGAAVALKVALELLSRDGTKADAAAMKSFIRHAVVLAGVATIGDVMPLVGDNRALVRQALLMIHDLDWPGLKELVRCSGLRSKATAEDLAFQLIPQINAAQRLGRSDVLWKLFSAKDSVEASEISGHLKALNESRKNLQGEGLRLVLEKLKREIPDTPPPAIVVAGKNWQPGISGLIASKISDMYRRPAVVILVRGDEAQGSARAPEGFNIKLALDACSGLLIQYGGHGCAAGFSLRPDNVPAFREAFCTVVAGQAASMLSSGRSPGRGILICDELFWPQLGQALTDDIARLEPFGYGNPRPVFACRDVYLDGSPRYTGNDRSHVMMNLYRPGQPAIGAVGFGLGDELRALDGTRELDIAFSLGRARGRSDVQLMLCGVRPHQKRG